MTSKKELIDKLLDFRKSCVAAIDFSREQEGKEEPASLGTWPSVTNTIQSCIDTFDSIFGEIKKEEICGECGGSAVIFLNPESVSDGSPVKYQTCGSCEDGENGRKTLLRAYVSLKERVG